MTRPRRFLVTQRAVRIVVALAFLIGLLIGWVVG